MREIIGRGLLVNGRRGGGVGEGGGSWRLVIGKREACG